MAIARIRRVVAAALLSVVPVLASAQQVAPAPARSAVPLPPPPAGTSLRRREGGDLTVGVGAWAALDRGESPAFHLDYGVRRTPAGWSRAELEWRLAVMLARPSEETGLSRTVTPPFGSPYTTSAGSEDMRVWLVEVVPMARIQRRLARGFSVHADAGLGLAQTLETYDRREMFAGQTVERRNVTGPVLRLAAGLALDLSPRTALRFVPFSLSFHLGSDFSGFAPFFGLSFRP